MIPTPATVPAATSLSDRVSTLSTGLAAAATAHSTAQSAARRGASDKRAATARHYACTLSARSACPHRCPALCVLSLQCVHRCCSRPVRGVHARVGGCAQCGRRDCGAGAARKAQTRRCGTHQETSRGRGAGEDDGHSNGGSRDAALSIEALLRSKWIRTARVWRYHYLSTAHCAPSSECVWIVRTD